MQHRLTSRLSMSLSTANVEELIRANFSGLNKKSLLERLETPDAPITKPCSDSICRTSVKSSKVISHLKQHPPTSLHLNRTSSSVERQLVLTQYIVLSDIWALFERQCEIIFGVSTPIQKVQMSGQWLVIANLYAKALKFTFPDRDSEFQTYICQILNLFAAKHESAHGKVIAYDKVVRSRVGGGTRLLLINQHKFFDLRDSTLNVDGINYGG